MLNLNSDLDQIRETFPHVVEEFERLRLWVFTLAGEHVAMPGGPNVDAPASEHAQAAAELAHQKGDTEAAEVMLAHAADLKRDEAGR